MFTGIIEETGRIATAGARLHVECSLVMADATPGCSIAVNGVCLTALDPSPQGFSADLAPETLRRTNLGDLASGSVVNLERPLAAGGRLSGHIVQGHVDGTGTVESFDALGDDNWWLRVRIPAELDRYVVHKGSICLDGISLTVAAIEDCIVSVTIIPHTVAHTNLRTRKPGDRINVETDILAKHVEKLAAVSVLR
ncbi:MAG: riboflavin synthase [Bryobacterales bacterium]|nr:riboflavin synthase [Bryobacterales bacterium]